MLLLPQSARAAEEMSFRIVSVGDPASCHAKCPQVIAAEGEITDRTPETFSAFVRQNLGGSNLRAVVFIHSPGGKVTASMRFGRVLRSIGAAVVVARARPGGGMTHFTGGRCFSACVYALMGGKRRVIPPQSEVGIHRMFTYESGNDPAGRTGERRREYDNGSMASMLEHYSSAMGISRSLVAEAEHVPSETLHIVSRAEMAHWRLGSPKF